MLACSPVMRLRWLFFVKLEGVSNMSFQDSIAQAAKNAHQDKAEADAERVRHILIDIQTKVFDRAAAYTNLIMFGGYVGGFAIWNFTRDMLGTSAQACALCRRLYFCQIL